jgi:hypothetical protein
MQISAGPSSSIARSLLNTLVCNFISRLDIELGGYTGGSSGAVLCVSLYHEHPFTKLNYREYQSAILHQWVLTVRRQPPRSVRTCPMSTAGMRRSRSISSW